MQKNHQNNELRHSDNLWKKFQAEFQEPDFDVGMIRSAFNKYVPSKQFLGTKIANLRYF